MEQWKIDKICKLFKGGKCPFCDDEYEDIGISYSEAQEINAECCKNSYTPTEEDLKEMGYINDSN